MILSILPIFFVIINYQSDRKLPIFLCLRFRPPFFGGGAIFLCQGSVSDSESCSPAFKRESKYAVTHPSSWSCDLGKRISGQKKGENPPLGISRGDVVLKKNEKSRSNESNRVLAALEGTLWPSGRHLLQQASSRLKLQKWSTRFFHHNNFPKRYFCTKFLRLGLWHCHLHMSKVESRV